MIDETEHAELLREAIDAAIAPWHSYDFDDEPKDKPRMYVLVSLSPTVGGSTRMCGGRASREWRLDTTEVANTVDEVRWLHRRLARAFNDKRIASLNTGLVSFQGDSGIRPKAKTDQFFCESERIYTAPIGGTT